MNKNLENKNLEIAKDIVEWAVGQLFVAEYNLNDDVSEAKNAIDLINLKPDKDFDDEQIEYKRYDMFKGVGMDYLSVIEDNRMYACIQEIMNSDLPEKPNPNQPKELQKLETTKEALINSLLKDLTYAAKYEGVIIGVRNMHESLDPCNCVELVQAIINIKNKQFGK